jgi:hypothetical protein
MSALYIELIVHWIKCVRPTTRIGEHVDIAIVTLHTKT